jgi:hypothetical protein
MLKPDVIRLRYMIDVAKETNSFIQKKEQATLTLTFF